MDYNTRAARAGTDGVGVGGAYVWRPPVAVAEDAEVLRRGRELYQDRFCGRRLRGETGPYEPHCRGDDCVEFAPREGNLPRTEPLRAAPRTPLVSCVMPTRDRDDFAIRAAQSFLGLTYPNRELVVV